MKVRIDSHLWKHFPMGGWDINIELFGLTLFEICQIYGGIDLIILNFRLTINWGRSYE